MSSAITAQLLVSVVITTLGKRPEMLRDAVRSIVEQDYDGPVEIVVVFDKSDIDPLTDLVLPEGRRIRLLKNKRKPGLAGGRNSGILAATGEVLGFCDDDDAWRRDKLRRQVSCWAGEPGAVAVASGITIQTSSSSMSRTAPRRTGFTDFLASRVTAIHPSTMLYRRSGFLDQHGLVDEGLPASYGEDYDLLLRATRHGDVIAVPDPLVLVRWDRPSYFAGHWEGIATGLTYILRKFPEFEQRPRGLARIAGQVAFAHAALGDRAAARAWSRSCLARDPGQLRAYAALLVGSRILDARRLVRLVERTGRGL